MKAVAINCTDVKYREFPELLFGSSIDGTRYFDATQYINSKGNPKEHKLSSFETQFNFFKNAVQRAYELDSENIIVLSQTTGNILIDESLALLFVAFIDPDFSVYLLERLDELFTNGIVLSDSAIVEQASNRFSKDQLQKLLI